MQPADRRGPPANAAAAPRPPRRSRGSSVAGGRLAVGLGDERRAIVGSAPDSNRPTAAALSYASGGTCARGRAGGHATARPRVAATRARIAPRHRRCWPSGRVAMRKVDGMEGGRGRRSDGMAAVGARSRRGNNLLTGAGRRLKGKMLLRRDGKQAVLDAGSPISHCSPLGPRADAAVQRDAVGGA
eukprot:11563-Chlamydomonas_euryale.AAC.2